MALKACAPERSDLLRNREEMQIVLESLDEGYCHVTRKTRDLKLVGTCSLVHLLRGFLFLTMSVYRCHGWYKGFCGTRWDFCTQLAHKDPKFHSTNIDLPEPESLIQRKHDVLARFLYILKPLVELFKIPKRSLQVFADKDGQLISFNRSGCLVMNLRYFEAWRMSWVSVFFQHSVLTEPFSDDFDVQRGDFNKALISWFVFQVHLIEPFADEVP